MKIVKVVMLMMLGYFFWQTVPSTNSTWSTGPFTFLNDCNAIRTSVSNAYATVYGTPVAGATPDPNHVIVHPGCFYMSEDRPNG